MDLKPQRQDTIARAGQGFGEGLECVEVPEALPRVRPQNASLAPGRGLIQD